MNEIEQDLALVASLLGKETTLTLATSGPGGDSWATPLFYVFGMSNGNPTLYWLSSESSLHSLNLEQSTRASAVVHAHAEGWKDICGVQMRGTVSKVTRTERRHELVKAYCNRFNLGLFFRVAIRGSVLYEFQPAFLRYLDNAKGFGYKFELERGPEGWRRTRGEV